MNLFSLFSGIGAFEKALDNLEIPYELTGFSEIDKYAVKSYCAIHNVEESKNYGDITKIDENKLPNNIDLITYGFPCQDISLAGKQKGMFNEDGSQTRSEQFKIVLDSLEEAGYYNYWQVLNAKDYGIPQNRERVFIVSIRKDIDTGSFKFPEGFPLQLRLKDMLEAEVDGKFYLDNEQTEKVKIKNPDALLYDKSMIGHENNAREYNDIAPTITSRDWKEPRLVNSTAQIIQTGILDIKGQDIVKRVYSPAGVSPTLTNMQGGNRQPKVMIEPSIQRVDIPQTVKVRKYPVDTENLCETLRHHKALQNLTNQGIAEALNVPVTKVEHWFRQDDCFAIPDAEIWFALKDLLDIGTNEFDKSIMVFEEKEGVFEKSERHYLSEGIAPTLTSATASEKVIEPSLRIRKLTPKECFRLMGFDDADFEKAEKVNSNTQLYKQAGNSIVVPVVEYIIKALIECGALTVDKQVEEPIAPPQTIPDKKTVTISAALTAADVAELKQFMKTRKFEYKVI